MGPLDGLVALVTGAGTGIGLEAAVRLARDGAAVACNGQERLGQPEEVAGLIAWLASPAAAYVSGTTVVIDGALMTQVSLA